MVILHPSVKAAIYKYLMLIGKNFYFVHSYVCLTKNKENTVAFSNYYDISIPAVVSLMMVKPRLFASEDNAAQKLIKNSMQLCLIAFLAISLIPS